MPDHSAGFRNKDLGKTRITDKIRVSSAAIHCQAHFGSYWQFETWIFSDDPRQRSRQVVHGTSSQRAYHYETKTRIVHQKIADNLMRKYGEGINHGYNGCTNTGLEIGSGPNDENDRSNGKDE